MSVFPRLNAPSPPPSPSPSTVLALTLALLLGELICRPAAAKNSVKADLERYQRKCAMCRPSIPRNAPTNYSDGDPHVPLGPNTCQIRKKGLQHYEFIINVSASRRWDFTDCCFVPYLMLIFDRNEDIGSDKVLPTCLLTIRHLHITGFGTLRYDAIPSLSPDDIIVGSEPLRWRGIRSEQTLTLSHFKNIEFDVFKLLPAYTKFVFWDGDCISCDSAFATRDKRRLSLKSSLCKLGFTLATVKVQHVVEAVSLLSEYFAGATIRYYLPTREEAESPSIRQMKSRPAFSTVRRLASIGIDPDDFEIPDHYSPPIDDEGQSQSGWFANWLWH